MEITENYIIKRLNTYFNSILRTYLKYPEIYSISYDISIQRITLISNSSNPKLIEQLQDKKLRNSIEQALLKGFKDKDEKILNVNIYTFKNDEIVITLTFGENPLELSELGILVKLASEYDVDRINELCTLNKNFTKACKNDLFWWELIKTKFPEYYREKRNNVYNPREVLKGLEYFKSIQNSRYLYSKLMFDYPETFRYVILENIWKLLRRQISSIFKNINLDNIEIIKHILLNYDVDDSELDDLFENMILRKDFNQTLIEEIDELVKSQGKELYTKTIIDGLLKRNKSKYFEEEYSKAYEWLTNKLK